MQWFYQDNGQSIGPVSEEEIARLVSANRITSTTLVKHEGLKDWMPLGRACGEPSVSQPSPSDDRRFKHRARGLKIIFIVLTIPLVFWPLSMVFGLMAICMAPSSPANILVVLLMLYPIILFLSWRRSRRALGVAQLRTAYLWVIPPALVMSPLLVVFFVNTLVYPFVEMYNTHIDPQGRFIEAIINQCDVDTVERFIRNGADVNRAGRSFSQSMAGTPLMTAMVHNRNPRVVAALLKAGADPRRDYSLQYAVSVTSARNDTNTAELVALLLKAGVSPSSGDILHQAIANKQPLDVVKLLVDAGAEVNCRDYFGKTPLIMAAWESEGPAIIQYLLSKGVDINAKDNDGDTAVVWAVSRKDGLPLLELLLKNGADINLRNNTEETALMKAARHRSDPAFVQTLIRHGADVNAKDKQGTTPLIDAATHNHAPEIIDVLVASGADVNARDGDGKTALIRASLQNTYDVCAALVRHGALPNVRDNSGKTALDYVGMYRKSEVGKYTALFKK